MPTSHSKYFFSLNKIPPGACRWGEGCDKPRKDGDYKKGASLMCEEHAERLAPIRALWDSQSPRCREIRHIIDPNKELRKIKLEMAIDDLLYKKYKKDSA